MKFLRISDIGFTVAEVARLHQQIQKGPGCWEWTGDDFAKKSGSTDGRQSICRPCATARRRRNRAPS